MKGTPSKGKRSGNKNMIYCRRCGGHTFNFGKEKCSACGFGKNTRLRSYTWQKKIH